MTECLTEAGVVKLADTQDLGSCAFGVGVQVPPSAHRMHAHRMHAGRMHTVCLRVKY